MPDDLRNFEIEIIDEYTRVESEIRETVKYLRWVSALVRTEFSAAKAPGLTKQLPGGDNRAEDKKLPDGPCPPNLLIWKGETYSIPPMQWQLLKYMWDRKSAAFEYVEAAMYGELDDSPESGVKSALGKLNPRLLKSGVPWTLGFKNGHIIKL